MGQRFDFTPSLDVQNIEIPITNGLTSLHAEFTISAPTDPLGRIVSILGLRGNLIGQGRKKKRPLHFNFTQGQDHQARFEAEITPENENGQERGPKMVFPGVYKIVIDWSMSGVADAEIFNIDGSLKGSFQISGLPSAQPITNGFLYIGGHVSKPPTPGEPPVYTAPIGCRLTGFVAFNGEKMEEEDNDNGSSPIEPMPVDPLLPVTPLIPPVIINPNPPVIKPSQPVTTPPVTPISSSGSGFNFDAFPQFVSAAAAFYPELGKSLGQIEPYIQAIQAGKRLADGNFNISNPNDLISVLQLISLFQRLN